MYVCGMFLERHAEYSYEEAALWARKMGEVYCIVLLRYFQREIRDWGLSEMVWDLPDWVWAHSAWEHADAMGNSYRDVAIRLGIQLSSATIYNDLNTLRWYGNTGAHASSYFDKGRQGANEKVFFAAIRLAMSFLVWHGRCSRL